MTDESKAIFEVDSSGRLLCPKCGEPLYAALEAQFSDIPAFSGTEEDTYGLDVWNCAAAKVREFYLSSLYCGVCDFATEPGLASFSQYTNQENAQ